MKSVEVGRAEASDTRVFLENTGDKISSIVHDDVDVSVNRDSLSSDRVKLAQRSRDVEFKSCGTLLLQFGKLGKGTSTGG